MRYKKLIRKPHFETVEDFQKFMFKCSAVVAGLFVLVFMALTLQASH